MNEELLKELSEAMKRRDKAAAAIARWTESRDDAVEDIKELSARITDADRVENPTGPEPESPMYVNPTQEYGYTPVHE